MKMVNVGKKSSNSYMAEKSAKDKVYFPDLRIEKNLGDFEVEDEVTLICKARVSGLRSDEYGSSITFQIKEVGVKDLEAKDIVSKTAENMLK